MTGERTVDRDPTSPRVRALEAVYAFLTSDEAGLAPNDAVAVALNGAGEIIASCMIGDTEAFIAEATMVLRDSIARFARDNPELMAAKRLRAQ